MITAKQFHTQHATMTNKLVSYYEGDQLRFVVDMLEGKNGMYGQRTRWKERGIIPRSRNITKSIVDKSGMVFNQPPTLNIWREGSDTPYVDETLQVLLERADWLEFFQNVDVYTRLTKSTIVLVQKYIPEESTTVNGQYRFNADNGEQMILTLLHQGNAVCHTDITGEIYELGYLIDSPFAEDGEVVDQSTLAEPAWYYRVINRDLIFDVRVTTDVSGEYVEEVYATTLNVDKFVPAVIFYDGNKPRHGVFPHPPEDLLSLQELYNLHLTDLEFSVAWQKQKTLFVNADIHAPQSSGQMYIPMARPGHTPPGSSYDEMLYGSGGSDYIGGLGDIVRIDNDGQGNQPLIKFDGPESNLQPLDQIVSSLVEQVARDWDVGLSFGGKGSATSGFQLVVEELPNLQLRIKRSQSFQGAMRRFYQVLQVLYPELPEGYLVVEFAEPDLPVNEKEQEEVWSLKITENRASVIDYLMETQNLTKEEAQEKYQEIIAINNLYKPVVIQPQKDAQSVEADESDDSDE